MRSFLRTATFILCLFLVTSSPARNYTFLGNGDWALPSNWDGGIIPPSFNISTGDTVIIRGTAVVPNCFSCTQLSAIAGGLIILRDGSLTLQNNTQFSLYSGMIQVFGTLVSETVFEVYAGTNIYIEGTFENKNWLGNQGNITIQNGGVFNNQTTGRFLNQNLGGRGHLIIDAGGAFNNYGTVKWEGGLVTNNGTLNARTTLTGNVTINGSLKNEGTLAPGNSPGLYTITGDYTAASTAIHNFEIGGTTPNDYDRLVAGGTAALDGTLNVSLINGFTPAIGNPDLPIITGTINGTFSTVNKPSQYQLVYNTNNVVLRALSVLPVIFSRFDVRKEGTGAQLYWRIETASNVSHYEIEKSGDGRVFSKAGEVKAALLQTYKYLDAVPFGGKTVYRIKSVDRDGKYTYSVMVQYAQGKSVVPLSIFPSPVNATISVQHTVAEPSHRLDIIGMDGRTLQTVYPANGAQKTEIRVSHLPSGVYVVRLYKGSEQLESTKFIKE